MNPTNPSKKPYIEISINKKAYHDYEIIDTLESGIVLQGTEIKSIRAHKINLKDSFVLIRDGEAKIYNMHISPYDFGNIYNHNPTRTRNLLLHKKEILKLSSQIEQKGLTIVPIKCYIKGKFAKLTLGVAKGKKLFDKKNDLKEKDIKRDVQREMKKFN